MGGAEQTLNPLGQFLPFILIFLIFYFLVIKPQKDKQKKLEEMKKEIKKNDQIVTAGGMHGTISLVKDTTVMLRVDDNVKIEIDKEAISTVINANSKQDNK